MVTDIIKFQNARLIYHVGNYSTLRESEEQMWSRNCGIAAAVAKKEKKAKDFIQKQRSMANNKRRDDNKLRQAKEREKKLSRYVDAKDIQLLQQESRGLVLLQLV